MLAGGAVEYMIKKLKDIFYDLNDILVALMIVALAAFVIATNMESILAYPSVIAEEIQLPEEEGPTQYAENPPITNEPGDEGGDEGTAGTADGDQNASGNGQNTSGGGVSGNEGPAGGTSGSEGAGSSGGAVVNYSVTIQYGMTGDQIADLFIGLGLFNDRREFNNAVTAAGKEGKLQAGTFTIPSDSTPAEVISIITR